MSNEYGCWSEVPTLEKPFVKSADQMQVEITTHCNLSCVYCPRDELTRTREHMPVELFEKILKTFAGDITTLILNKDGEPLMHPKFFEILNKISTNYKGKIDLYTNATYLTEQVIDAFGSVPNEIHILSTEHWNRRGNNLPTVKGTRANTIKAIEKNYKNVKFHLTVHHVEDVFTEDEVKWKNEMLERQRSYQNILSIHVNYAINPWLGWNKMPGIVQFKICPFTDVRSIFFGVTGNMIPCCIDLNEEMVLGNINTHTREELLMNWEDVMNKLRAKRHKELVPCDRCISD